MRSGGLPFHAQIRVGECCRLHFWVKPMLFIARSDPAENASEDDKQ